MTSRAGPASIPTALRRGGHRPGAGRVLLHAALRRGGYRLWLGSVGVLALAVAMAVSILRPYDAGADTDLARRFALPGSEGPWWTLPLGRDMYGRDLARVLVEGTQAFVGPGLVALAVAIPLALLLAVTWPRPETAPRTEQVLTLAVGSVPTLVWLLLASVAGGQSPMWVAIALAVVRAPDLTASLRAGFARLDTHGVLEGARAHRLPERHIRWIHLAWLEGTPALLRQGAWLFCAVLLSEASLSYLGDFGVPEPIPSWGRLLRDLSPQLFRLDPDASMLLAATPAVAIVVTVTSLLAFGEGLARVCERHRFAPWLEQAAAPASSVCTPSSAPGPSDPHSAVAMAPEDRREGGIDPLLEVRGLTLEAHGRGILEDVSFDVRPGTCTAIVGESGVGKTLLLRAVLGRLPAGIQQVCGAVRLDGHDHRGASRPLLVSRGVRIGWVGQHPAQSFDPLRSVGDHLADALGVRRWWRPRDPRVEDWLDRLGLPPACASQRAMALSGGMARRAAMAWALAGGARLLLADEPTTGLDPVRQLELLDLFRSLRETGVGVVLVTHDLRLAARAAEHIVVLHHGRVVESGPTSDVLAGRGHPYVRRLIDSARALSRGRNEVLRVPRVSAPRHEGCPARGDCARQPAGTRVCHTPPPLREVAPSHTIRCHFAVPGEPE